MYVYTRDYTQMFIVALYIIVKKWRQHKCTSTQEWINKMWYITQWNVIWPFKEWNINICYIMDEP